MRVGSWGSSLLLLVAASLAPACSESPRVQSAPRVTATGPVYTTPALAPDTGNVVAFYFTLADAEDLPADVLFEVSRGTGAFAEIGSSAATGAVVAGGDGVKALTAPPSGRVHRFLWKPPADLGASEEVRFRLTPSEPKLLGPPRELPGVVGTAVTSAPFVVVELPVEPR